jgi:hypothetical protein
MADECDIASESSQRMLDAVLERQRRSLGTKLAPAPGGLCANECGEPAMPDAACCSRECLDDLDRRKHLSSRTQVAN